MVNLVKELFFCFLKLSGISINNGEQEVTYNMIHAYLYLGNFLHKLMKPYVSVLCPCIVRRGRTL